MMVSLPPSHRARMARGVRRRTDRRSKFKAIVRHPLLRLTSSQKRPCPQTFRERLFRISWLRLLCRVCFAVRMQPFSVSASNENSVTAETSKVFTKERETSLRLEPMVSPPSTFAQPNGLTQKATLIANAVEAASGTQSHPSQEKQPEQSRPVILPASQCKSRTEMDTRLIDDKVAAGMEKIRSQIQSSMGLYCTDRAVDDKAVCHFLPQPGQGLEQVYQAFLGSPTQGWRERLIDLEHREKSYELKTNFALEGLVDAVARALERLRKAVFILLWRCSE